MSERAASVPIAERRLNAVLVAILIGAIVGALIVVTAGPASAQVNPDPADDPTTAALPAPDDPARAATTAAPGTSAWGTSAPATTAAPTPNPAAPTVAGGGGGRRYVALGDSFAAGSAAPVDPASGSCRRSAQAYPALLAPGLVGGQWTSRACASTTGGPNSQFDSLGADTAIVTITVGSDATGLGVLAHACGAAGDVATCNAAAARFERALAALPGALDTAFAGLRARAPSAKVTVTGYPLVAEGLACPAGPVDQDRARRVDDAVVRLDATLAGRAVAAGMSFIDLRLPFSGHGVCSTDPWLAPATVADPLLAGSATVPGQSLGAVGAVGPSVWAAALPSTPTTSPATTSPATTSPATTTPAAALPATPAATSVPAVAAVPALPARSLDGLVQPLFGT